MATETLPSLESLRNAKQPPLIYDIHKGWRSNVIDGPVWLGGFPPMPTETSYSFLGNPLISPIECAAGPAGGRKWTQFGLKMGYGIVNQKTMRSVSWEGNEGPNIALIESTPAVDPNSMPDRLQGSLDPFMAELLANMGNSFGNPSFRMPIWAWELREQLKDVGYGQLLAMSVTPTVRDHPLSQQIFNLNSEDVLAMEAAHDVVHAAVAGVIAGATMLEFNFSCNNVVQHPQEGQMYQNPKLVGYAVRLFKEMFPEVKLGIKTGPYNDLDQMMRVFAACEDQLDFVSLINTVPAKVEGEPEHEILPGRAKIGLSGPAIHPLALKNVGLAALARERLGINLGIKGGGGVETPKDAQNMQDEGAEIVFIANRFLRDPRFAYEDRLYRAGQAA